MLLDQLISVLFIKSRVVVLLYLWPQIYYNPEMVSLGKLSQNVFLMKGTHISPSWIPPNEGIPWALHKKFSRPSILFSLHPSGCDNTYYFFFFLVQSLGITMPIPWHKLCMLLLLLSHFSLYVPKCIISYSPEISIIFQ